LEQLILVERVNREKMIELDYNDEENSDRFLSGGLEKERESIVEKIFQENEKHFREYGVRPIKHYIEKEIGTLIARGIVSQYIQPGGRYRLDLEEGTNEIKITHLRSLETKKTC
jgi:ATP-dependent Clp protease ATP-binding subunit ClpA